MPQPPSPTPDDDGKDDIVARLDKIDQRLLWLLLLSIANLVILSFSLVPWK